MSSSPLSTSLDDTQRLKTVLATVARTLSGDENTAADKAVVTGASIIQDPSDRKQTRQLMRGESDSRALYQRHHDFNAASEAFLPGAPPPLPGSRTHAVLEQMERYRCEAHGSRDFPGIQANLYSVLEARLGRLGTGNMNEKSAMPSGLALELLTWEALNERPLPASLTGESFKHWRSNLSPTARNLLARMRAAEGDQRQFQALSRQFLEAGLNAAQEPSARPDSEPSDTPQSTAADQDSERSSPAQTPEAPEKRGESVTEIQPVPSEPALHSGSHGPTEEGSLDKPGATGTLDTLSTPLSSEELETLLAWGGEQEDTEAAEAKTASEESPLQGEGQTGSKERSAGYHVYTTCYDEEVEAAALCDAEELQELQEELEALSVQTQNVVNRLGHRLQHRLQAQQQRHWSFDQEEGLLDAARLPRLITTPGLGLTYKRESESSFRDTVVTLLLDNSGSMRGRPIATAALCAGILSRTLERCNVKVEILGFTTRAWKGGQSRKQWLSEDRPSHPGRLNDLRHIIYKSADQPWRRARHNLGVMLKEGLLKENIDGEALLWAAGRLKQRPEKRRILLVVSDGAPVDDSTSSANGPDFLDAHLREVVTQLEADPALELRAIGIGHDVTRTYAHSVTIRHAEDLGDTLIRQLDSLFVSPAGLRRKTGNRRSRPAGRQVGR
ncbi:cobaltochelatase subunit CobT [Oecophyllibacter saccharovorans]|uniref:cobaltochelatase CobT-related protein n=1 Tax=Oecophyllibacter saccharovorans TaxID=2558360 RepID=UPI001143DEC8|nr:cobaltochelatase subunit CobT [Oecophyllibacter saccharovorans]QDH14610.1 cobaltochelatase subunit CobT [Oecophyllibacter saccharovorans]